MTIFEKARRYYPGQWGLERIQNLVYNRILSPEEFYIITESTYDGNFKDMSDEIPTGTIISIMSNVAPNGYLICSGDLLSYDNYKRLGDFFEDQFGSRNYFGGTEDQFALPDLRNHFLRGYHGSAETLSGDIGVTQEATRHNQIWICKGPEVGIMVPNTVLNEGDPIEGEILYHETRRYWSMYNQDTLSNIQTTAVLPSLRNETYSAGSSFNSHYTSRPINTSVLFCIKY